LGSPNSMQKRSSNNQPSSITVSTANSQKSTNSDVPKLPYLANNNSKTTSSHDPSKNQPQRVNQLEATQSMDQFKYDKNQKRGMTSNSFDSTDSKRIYKWHLW
jgi:hypothetical protein